MLEYHTTFNFVFLSIFLCIHLLIGGVLEFVKYRPSFAFFVILMFSLFTILFNNEIKSFDLIWFVLFCLNSDKFLPIWWWKWLRGGSYKSLFSNDSSLIPFRLINLYLTIPTIVDCRYSLDCTRLSLVYSSTRSLAPRVTSRLVRRPSCRYWPLSSVQPSRMTQLWRSRWRLLVE